MAKVLELIIRFNKVWTYSWVDDKSTIDWRDKSIAYMSTRTKANHVALIDSGRYHCFHRLTGLRQYHYLFVAFLLALPTSYALGRRKLRGKELYKLLMLFPLAFPGMAMAMFLGRLLFAQGLSGTYTGVIMAHVLICLPYMLRILTVSFESVPQELIDAADNLGATGWVKFKEIYMPMVLPGLVAGAIFSFITSVEEFNLTFIIGAPQIQTIPTILYTYLGQNFLRTSASVVSLILVVPNIIVLLITERFIKTEYMGAALGKM